METTAIVAAILALLAALLSMGTLRRMSEIPRRMSSPAASESPLTGLAAAWDSLTEGRVLFNPARQMRAGAIERVEVRVTRRLMMELEDLTTGLRGRGEPEVENISVGPFMKVRLRGPTFEITELSHQGQVVPDDGFAQWEWDVTPVKSGVRTLQLLVTVRLKLPHSAEEPMDLPVLERNIQVSISPLFSSKRFVSRNWKWIGTSILIPVIAWGLKKLWPS